MEQFNSEAQSWKSMILDIYVSVPLSLSLSLSLYLPPYAIHPSLGDECMHYSEMSACTVWATHRREAACARNCVLRAASGGGGRRL